MLAAVSAVPSAVPLFGCFFVGHSYPILSNQGFQQVGNWGEGRGASVPGGFDAWGLWCLRDLVPGRLPCLGRGFYAGRVLSDCDLTDLIAACITEGPGILVICTA